MGKNDGFGCLRKTYSMSKWVKCVIFICFNESPLKMVKNAFCFLVKALFVLKIFKFWPWLFGHVEKTAWLERYG